MGSVNGSRVHEHVTEQPTSRLRGGTCHSEQHSASAVVATGHVRQETLAEASTQKWTHEHNRHGEARDTSLQSIKMYEVELQVVPDQFQR